jgi:hypothetical protein
MQTTAAKAPNINSKSLTVASLMLRKRRTSMLGNWALIRVRNSLCVDMIRQKSGAIAPVHV